MFPGKGLSMPREKSAQGPGETERSASGGCSKRKESILISGAWWNSRNSGGRTVEKRKIPLVPEVRGKGEGLRPTNGQRGVGMF